MFKLEVKNNDNKWIFHINLKVSSTIIYPIYHYVMYALILMSHFLHNLVLIRIGSEKAGSIINESRNEVWGLERRFTMTS